MPTCRVGEGPAPGGSTAAAAESDDAGDGEFDDFADSFWHEIAPPLPMANDAVVGVDSETAEWNEAHVKKFEAEFQRVWKAV